MPTATMLGQTVSIKGNGAEHVGGVEGAVDRIAVEILRRLEQGRTLVVWAFDASGSLQAERQRLSKHIETVYTHIGQLDENHLAADKGLLTLVVAFGQDRKAMTPKPTAELSEILEAIGEVPTDETGDRDHLHHRAEIVRRWGRYKDQAGQAYHPMVIVVTDEVGDDENRLEEAIELAAAGQGAGLRARLAGASSAGSRATWITSTPRPSTSSTASRSARGRKAPCSSRSACRSGTSGPQYDILEAGFGPYALSRLASATGGIYFVTRFTGRRMGFDPIRMKEYKPDWVRRDQYEAAIAKSPLRQAVLNAAQITQQRLPGMPSSGLPRGGEPRVQGGHGRQPGHRRADGLHGRRGARADQLRRPSCATARPPGAGRPTTT